MDITNNAYLNFSFLTQFIHPLLMLGLFVYLLYTAYLGFQTRRTRNAEGDNKKALLQGKYATRHYQSGAIILAVMILGAFGGIVSTYLSAGEIPAIAHLFVGLGMTALIAIAAALVPLMQRGQLWARQIHIGANVTLLLLFSWQIFTGLEIVQELLTQSPS
ncbi:hypothetical protein N836_28605 [Leptolyngbya sp. Heron Island J]|uniref:DUF4079 domain-containing protein n=1 Tax=Leptolyngbya sp. Heron Island J TaxID=1385935 RepID=UPI0003B9F739|nr:DUF4079 domain-containing protein [Leptolyngbya sp. Heron Island J]ESA31958.1 hypothetical protein N836_28605 [Leptolyngbya sp. Heron Island J]